MSEEKLPQCLDGNAHTQKCLPSSEPPALHLLHLQWAPNSFACTVGSFTYMLRSELIHSEGNNDSQRWRIALTQSPPDVFHQLWLLAVRAAKWGREGRGGGGGGFSSSSTHMGCITICF